ncbi:hypothetical protein TCAL_00862 [Tigriopus californicus]|uniref:tRNA N(3)-methylcytidine methyltransferase n=1 Tax=Tigriopus californicus TaxID=6832 RepID=A0A553NAS4_TIGCA|nr:tRNA N(3)-methylcytidine methyltransferase METTL6-like [Tigriopus californicus]TRY62541.1 hypothetical protein TCAL_00862 [Tigriopus californicus]|eukprot:TCALIF_00862-PA protein Name:"Similar to Mettl6 Methyltransferase-like protein 6 (Mus musculus)" AED:0.19 eAED:0.19 QI:0/0/0/1/1/1/2/0/281
MGDVWEGKTQGRSLSEEEQSRLSRQDERRVNEFKANKFQREAQKHWDLFYKRNTTNFFKDRHWTTREFQDLLPSSDDSHGTDSPRPTLLELGCGVGNFVFPLIEEDTSLFIYACDFSPRAVELLKAHSKYNEDHIKAFQCDITQSITPRVPDPGQKMDLVSMVFVLSALRPCDFDVALRNVCDCMKEGGVLLFRDYAVNDMAMVRFGPGHKIRDQLYLRQDGTTSYFFEIEFLRDLMTRAGFKVLHLDYIQRKTVNKKENVDAERLFVQGRFLKSTKIIVK